MTTRTLTVAFAACLCAAGCGHESSSTPCTTDDDCSATAHCLVGVCFEGCHLDSDCSPGQHCGAHGLCGAPPTDAAPGDAAPADAAIDAPAGGDAAPTDAPLPDDARTGDAPGNDAAPSDTLPQSDAAQSDTLPQSDAAQSDTLPQSDAAQTDAPPDGPPCSNGTERCLGTLLQLCNGGAWQNVTTCPVRCDDTLGCIECTPSTNYCVGDTVYACTAQGHQGAAVQTCNPGQCQGGACVDPCAALAGSPSHLGCEHFATLTMNSQVPQGPGFNFAVAVVNPGPTSATVTVTGGGLSTPKVQTVAAGTAATITLPWVAALGDSADTGLSALATGGAYKIVSTAPVGVYQYNVLEVTGTTGTTCSIFLECASLQCTGGYCVDTSGTNGASLVLPTRVLGRDYYAVTKPTYGTTTCTYDTNNLPQYSTTWYPGYFAVVATQPGATTVTVAFAGNAGSGTGVPTAYNKGQTGTFTLNQGDVLQLASRGATSCATSCSGTCGSGTTQTCYCNDVNSDLTGTHITSDKDVAVFSGHEFTQVPVTNGYGEHFEEELWPVGVWGKRAVAVPTQDPGVRPNVFRLVSGADGNSLTFNPAVTTNGVLNRGQWREFTTSSAFEVIGSGRFVLAQLSEGRQAGGSSATGDPGMTFVVPVEQFRTEYRVYVPAEYASSAAIVAPVGATIQLDGVAVGGFASVGSGTYAGATVATVSPGFHVFTGSAAFSAQLYGSADRTSYAYPAGLNFTPQP